MKTKWEAYGQLRQWHSEVIKSGVPPASALRKSPKARELVNMLHIALFNKSAGVCINCQTEALEAIMSVSEDKMRAIMECRFRLRGGVLLVGGGGLPNATNGNLTDDLALAFLSRYPKRITLFEKYPKNWKLLCRNYKARQEKLRSKDESGDTEVRQGQV